MSIIHLLLCTPCNILTINLKKLDGGQPSYILLKQTLQYKAGNENLHSW